MFGQKEANLFKRKKNKSWAVDEVKKGKRLPITEMPLSFQLNIYIAGVYFLYFLHVIFTFI